MEILTHSLIFVFSFLLISLASNQLINSLSKIAKFLSWKEFVVAFFMVAFSVSIPNFFVGIMSAIQKIPQLSFGDVIGGNVVAMTLLVALAALISKAGLSAMSRTVQGSLFFTIFIGILPIILGLDGKLERSDGILLLFCFLGYLIWLFQKKERFTKIYNGIPTPLSLTFFFKNLLLFLISIIILLISSRFIVTCAKFFAKYLNIPLTSIGILIVSLGNNIPELTFVLEAAKKNQDWLILGDLMGGVIVTSTLVLGVVCLICPIEIVNLPSIFVARFFLIFSALFFLFIVRSDKKITKGEGIVLLAIYLIFLLVEFLVK